MKTSILALYRSGQDVFRQWGADLTPSPVPGLVVWGERDVYAAPRYGASLAQATGAAFACLEGCGHWWQRERPEETAAAVIAFWRRAGL